MGLLKGDARGLDCSSHDPCGGSMFFWGSVLVAHWFGGLRGGWDSDISGRHCEPRRLPQCVAQLGPRASSQAT